MPSERSDIDNLAGLRVIDRATRYIKGQFSLRMTKAEAQAHFDARALLLKCANVIFRDAGCPITKEEIEGARIIEREMGHAE